MENLPKVTVYNYGENFTDENVTLDECVNYKDKTGITWIDVKDVSSDQSIEKISDCYNLHQLVRESLLEQSKRAKIEDHGDYLSEKY
jgi:magnesium transporter